MKRGGKGKMQDTVILQICNIPIIIHKTNVFHFLIIAWTV